MGKKRVMTDTTKLDEIRKLYPEAKLLKNADVVNFSLDKMIAEAVV